MNLCSINTSGQCGHIFRSRGTSSRMYWTNIMSSMLLSICNTNTIRTMWQYLPKQVVHHLGGIGQMSNILASMFLSICNTNTI